MTWLTFSLTAFLVSGLTLFSRFGLGTVLMPAFALVGRDADWGVVWSFSLPAALAAIAGASLLALFAGLAAGML